MVLLSMVLLSRRLPSRQPLAQRLPLRHHVVATRQATNHLQVVDDQLQGLR